MPEGPRLSRPRRAPERGIRGDAGGPGPAPGGARDRPAPGRPAQHDADPDLWMYEGALSFVTTLCSSHRDSPYKRECGRQNDRRPSSRIPTFDQKPTRSPPRRTSGEIRLSL
jgi:hypothetical protein